MARATTKKTVAERTISNKKDIKTSFALGRRIKSGVSSASSIGSGQGSGGAINLSGNFLETVGGTMMGPIAFYPQQISILNDSIDISINAGNYSSYVQAVGQTAADNLSKIIGTGFSGQILVIEAVLGDTITLKDTGVVGDNIHLPGGSDVIINGLDAVTLIYDPTISPSGKWILSNGISSGGSSGGANLALSNLNTTSINQHLLPGTDGILDMGGLGGPNRWRNIFITGLVSANQIAAGGFNIEAITIGANWQKFNSLSSSVVTTPPAPSTTNLFLNSSTGELSVKKSTGLTVSLEAINSDFADNVFKIHDDLDSTSSIIFNLDGMTTGVQSAIVFSDTSGRVYTMPNITTVLAGWAVPNVFTLPNTFNADVTFNGNIILGNSSADNIIFNGDIVGNLTPNTTNVSDLGILGKAWRDIFSVGIAHLTTIDGPTTVIGGTTFTSTVVFNGSNTSINSSTIILGDSISDILSINAKVGFYGVPPVIRQIAGGFSSASDTLQQLKDKYNITRSALITTGLLSA